MRKLFSFPNSIQICHSRVVFTKRLTTLLRRFLRRGCPHYKMEILKNQLTLSTKSPKPINDRKKFGSNFVNTSPEAEPKLEQSSKDQN
jgi:hypothetical protein